MTGPAAGAAAACRRALDAALAARGALAESELRALRTAPGAALDEALRSFAADHGAEALPLLAALASDTTERVLRRAAKRALYRLALRGVAAPPPRSPRPVIERRPERAVRAWLSGVDGSGSRATWILFEGAWGGRSLCSLILNDVTGIVDAAGGEISKRRLETELARLRAAQKLPWVETEPARAVGLVAEALALHRAGGTVPPQAFARWQRFFASAPLPEPPTVPAEAEAGRVERSAELLELPELAGWFLDPDAVQADALELLEARESRLVVSGQVKAEREAAIARKVVERELTPDARRRWARRLTEMAEIFRATGRPEPAGLALAAATALADPTRDVAHHPFARALARRALEVAAEVAVGRVSAADVSRKPSARA